MELETRFAQRLSEAVQFRTVSNPDRSKMDFSEFEAFLGWVEKAWPRVAETLELERINGYSLLGRWRGESNEPGFMYMAHYDVVPVGDPGLWLQEPFSGVILDGELWGRGSIDCKHEVVAILEVIDSLIERGYRPRRDIWFFFGHDEEVGGEDGALYLTKLLEVRGIRLRGLINEGGGLSDGRDFGVDGLTAVISVAEKGSLVLEVTVNGRSGHSARPNPENAITLLADFISQLNKHPMKARLLPTVENTFKVLAEHAGDEKELFADLAGHWEEAQEKFSSNPQFNPFIRSTFAFTMLKAGIAANIIPDSATAVINIRLLPGESAQDVLEYVKSFANSEDFSFRYIQKAEASHETPIGTTEWQALVDVIKAHFPIRLVLPHLLPAGTDARYFGKLTDNIFRFDGLQLSNEHRRTVHSVNERLSVDSLGKLKVFMQDLMLKFDQLD